MTPRAHVALLLACTLTACSAQGSLDGAVDPSPAAPPAALAEQRSAFFSLEDVHRVEISLSDSAVATLGEDPYSYVSGDVTIDDTVLPSSGVRLKGKWGSFRELAKKSAFLLQFGEFEDDQAFLGMNKLAFNNMVQDPSHLHEHLAYQLFRAGDAPASRVAYAWIRVNDEDYGLYSAIEVVDNDHFLSEWFPDEDGNLYEGEYGVDLFPGAVPEFDQDAGSDTSRDDLEELVETLDGIEQSAEAGSFDVLGSLSEHLDMDRFLTFSATELYLGHWDGYSWSRNNYFIYRAEDDGPWTWLPWGLDQVFWEHLPPIEGEGRIHQLCMSSEPCRVAFTEQLVRVIDRAEELDLLGQTWLIEEHIEQAIADDPRIEVDLDVWRWAVDETRNFIEDRPETIAEQACLDSQEVDDDGDGFSGCYEDCDDSDAQVHPEAPEVCNFRDDNCDGSIDEEDECTGCIPWDSPNGTSYNLCLLSRSWEEARSDCLEQGGDLASIHDAQTQAWLVTAVYTLQWEGEPVYAETGNWWHGLNDRQQEGQWAWTDGSPVDFEAWGEGEPNNAGTEDCAHIAYWSEGRWNDLHCEAVASYICQLP